MARSAAAVVSGFERFDDDLAYAGVIFNNLGSERHLGYLKDALEDNVRMACLGGIPRNESIAIPERHLGLVTQQDHELTAENIEALANLMEETIDLDKLVAALPDGASVVTVTGRYYAMDRDNRWERVSRAYGAMINGQGIAADDAVSASFVLGHSLLSGMRFGGMY